MIFHMKTLFPRRLLTALLLFATGPALPAGAPSFDGIWTIDGTTDVGPCDKTFHGEVRIEHNDIVSAGADVAQAIGSIEPNGTVWARLTRPDGQARANGRFRGKTASGAWSSNTAYCGGRWSARKTG